MAPATAASADALRMVPQLLVVARTWSSGSPLDFCAAAAVRNEMLAANHRRHVIDIPAYAEVAREAGVGAGADIAELRERLVLSDEWFKSYDPAWLEGDLASLTDWLGTVSTLPGRPPAGATDFWSWRSGLRNEGVFVTVSSATTGQPSLVPRDRVTLAALRSSSGVRLPWSLQPGEYDSLLLTPAGMGSGLQSGAAGLAAAARRIHHFEDPGSMEFLQAAVTQQQRVVLYGSPSRLDDLVDEMTRAGMQVELPEGSCVLTGGGWKQDPAHDIGSLLDRASVCLGVDRGRCVDTYSAAELNTVFVSCSQGRYHVPPVVEAVVVDDLLRPLPGDGDGRLAVLDPMAMSYPGRLATSDHVHLRHDPCPCGLSGQTLLPPVTRLLDATPRGCGVTDIAANR
jgi:hypothetical protein